jgi:ABC-type branched-subunit amino acid transport system ATPase component/ABC-type branched-subunit amino acid transport system permease subunit
MTGTAREPNPSPRRLAPLPRTVVLVGLLCLAVASPWLGLPRISTNLMTTVAIYGIAASGLNLMFGYAGMLSLGNAIFLGIGGYTTGIATQDWHWPTVPSMVLAVVLTGIVAALLGSLLVRLSGHYFGVATLGLALAFDSLLVAVPGTGGGTGLFMTPSLSLGFVTIATKAQWYAFVLVVAVLVLLFLSWFVAGKRGRLLRLVRHDELAAEVLGVPVLRTKLIAFAIGGAITGIAGTLLFTSTGLINPDTVGLLVSVQLTMLVVIGGPGYRLGGLVGAFTVLWLQALLNSFGNYELLIYAGALLAVVFYLRPGIEGAIVEGWRLIRWPQWLTQPAAVAPGPTDREPAAATSAVQSEGLIVRNVKRSFGGVIAVNDVSLDVPPGQVTALIGANGAGKSTLLNLISGVEPLQAGTIMMGDKDISGLAPAQRSQYGLVRTFQVPRLVDELSVLENIVIGHEASERPLLRRSRQVEDARLRQARATLAALDLDGLADRSASSLGTGERKYVEVARAIFSQASVMLLDEPAVGLSVDEVDQLRGWLETMRAGGTAILVIDHNIDFIRDLADQVYSMESGRITHQGKPEDLEMPSFQKRSASPAPANGPDPTFPPVTTEIGLSG